MLHTLREVGEFVGIPQDASEYGHPSYIGLRQAGDLIAPLTPDEQRRSLRGIIDRLDSLPPLTLNAQVLAANGYQPVPVRVHLEPTASLVISTKVVVLANVPWFTSANLGSSSGDIDITELYAAENSEYVFYRIYVRRAGIGPGGYGILESPALQVWARYPPPDPKHDPPPPVRPTISVHERTSKRAHGLGPRIWLPQKPETGPDRHRYTPGRRGKDPGPATLLRRVCGNGVVDAQVAPVDTTTLCRDGSPIRPGSPCRQRTVGSTPTACQPGSHYGATPCSLTF